VPAAYPARSPFPRTGVGAKARFLARQSFFLFSENFVDIFLRRSIVDWSDL
jgi:hypothetical protein